MEDRECGAGKKMRQDGSAEFTSGFLSQRLFGFSEKSVKEQDSAQKICYNDSIGYCV